MDGRKEERGPIVRRDARAKREERGAYTRRWVGDYRSLGTQMESYAAKYRVWGQQKPITTPSPTTLEWRETEPPKTVQLGASPLHFRTTWTANQVRLDVCYILRDYAFRCEGGQIYPMNSSPRGRCRLCICTLTPLWHRPA